jgi:arginine utilization protein RocB
MDTILEMMNWVRGSSELLERTVENVETAMLELSLHDDDVFEDVSAKVRRACEDLSVRPKILTLHEYRTSALVALGALVAANKM